MRTSRSLQVQRHEADHQIAIWMTLGPDYVGKISRRPNHNSLARVELTDVPHRHPALNAADLAVVRLIPLFDDACDVAGSEVDVSFVTELCAPIAYGYRPDHQKSIHGDEWLEDWLHGTIARRCRELLDSSRFRKLRATLEQALDHHSEMPAEDVRDVLRSADT
jgi:hypothetical protein